MGVAGTAAAKSRAVNPASVAAALFFEACAATGPRPQIPRTLCIRLCCHARIPKHPGWRLLRLLFRIRGDKFDANFELTFSISGRFQPNAEGPEDVDREVGNYLFLDVDEASSEPAQSLASDRYHATSST